MRILAAGGMIFISLFVVTGCHCHTWGDRYSDLIDDISDHKAEWDCYYNPCLDISRSGKPDWCRCKWNRLLCPCACEASGYCANCDAVHFEGLGVEIPENELNTIPQQERKKSPGIPPELIPKIPLEPPPKPGKKAPGIVETLEE